MRATFTDLQDALREALRDLLSDHAGSAVVRAAADDDDGFDADLWGLLVDMGVTDLPSTVERGVVAEELGRVVAPVPYVEHEVAVAALRASAPDHGLLADMVSGDVRAVYAAGQVVGIEDGAAHGRLMAVPHAATATHLLLDADDGDRQVLAVIDLAAARRQILRTMDRTRPLADVVLDTTPAMVVGQLATTSAGIDGGVQAAATLTAATLYAHDLVGVGQTCLDMGVAHARTREQFGKLIGTYQAVSHRLVDMFVALESARSHAYHAAWAVAAEEDVAPLAASQAKAAASHAAVVCAQGAMQVHGGLGFTWEHDLHLYLKRAQSGAAQVGGVPDHKRRIADLIGV